MLAEPAGGWSATLNGHPLTPLAAPVNGWAQGFRLPAGGGSLSVSHSDFGRAALLGLEGLAVLVAIGLALPGPRAAAEAELEEPAQGDDALGAQEPGRRRASHSREPEERSRRRRTPRRGQDEPPLPPGTEVPRPAVPAQALGRRAAAVPAGVQAGRAQRGGPPGAEDPYPGDEAQQGGPSYPGGDSFPGDSFPGDPGYPGSPVPAQPASAGRGRRAAADLTSETLAYRAPNGGTTGRHSHRAGQDQAGRGPATEPGRPPQDYGPPLPARAAVPGRATTPGPDTRPGRGATRLGPATTPGCHPVRARTPRADAASGPAVPGGTTGRQAARLTIPRGAVLLAAVAPRRPARAAGPATSRRPITRHGSASPCPSGVAPRARTGPAGSAVSGAARRRRRRAGPRSLPPATLVHTTAAAARTAAIRARVTRAAPTPAVPMRAAGLRAAPAGVTTRERIRAAPTRAVPIRATGPRAAVRAGVLRAAPIRVVPMRAAGLRAAAPAGVTTRGRIRAAPIPSGSHQGDRSSGGRGFAREPFERPLSEWFL